MNKRESNLFKVHPKYEMNKEHEPYVLNQITEKLNGDTGIQILQYERILTGQNIIFKLRTESEKTLLLKIISRKGYPCIETLKTCYRYLKNNELKSPELVYYDLTNQIVPYGFLIQTWISGSVYDDQEDKDWIEVFGEQLNKLHITTLTTFGSLTNGPSYPSLQSYYNHMDEVVNYSFGDLFATSFTIWDLERFDLVSTNFLTNTFERVKKLAAKIKTNPTPVLLHGDLFPKNLIKTDTGPVMIDWDETRTGWWVYEIARTVYYMKDETLLKSFLQVYTHNTPIEDILIGIRLEHIRQLLRQLVITGINTNTANIKETRRNMKKIEIKIVEKFDGALF